MRVRVISDLHLEFGDLDLPEVPCDCVVLAGDVHTKTNARQWIISQFGDIPVFYVLGNHEYYGEKIPALAEKLKSAFSGTNVHVLENEVVTLEGVAIFGTTLWSDMKLFGDPLVGSAHAGEMSDFKRIRLSSTFRRFRPVDARKLHSEAKLQIEKFLRNTARRRIVVTHHAPSIRSLPECLRTEPVSCGYASNLDDLVAAQGPDLWIHGHIHSSSDYTLGRTHVIANPRGYPDELNPDFKPDLVIEI